MTCKPPSFSEVPLADVCFCLHYLLEHAGYVDKLGSAVLQYSQNAVLSKSNTLCAIKKKSCRNNKKCENLEYYFIASIFSNIKLQSVFRLSCTVTNENRLNNLLPLS